MTTPTTPQSPEAKPSDHRVLWLMSEYATACCASDFKRAGQLWNEAARILLAASGKAGAVGVPPRAVLRDSMIGITHVITMDKVTFYRDSAKPGNAFSQLCDKLESAWSAAIAAQEKQQ